MAEHGGSASACVFPPPLAHSLLPRLRTAARRTASGLPRLRAVAPPPCPSRSGNTRRIPLALPRSRLLAPPPCPARADAGRHPPGNTRCSSLCAASPRASSTSAMAQGNRGGAPTPLPQLGARATLSLPQLQATTTSNADPTPNHPTSIEDGARWQFFIHANAECKPNCCRQQLGHR